MESDISELIETAAPTNNEEEEEDSIPVESVDEEERFKDGFEDGEPVLCKPEPRPMKLQRAEFVLAGITYKREGQVIFVFNTRTKKAAPWLSKKRRTGAHSRKVYGGVNNSKNSKRSNHAWSIQHYTKSGETKRTKTKLELVSELHTCNKELCNEHQKNQMSKPKQVFVLSKRKKTSPLSQHQMGV